MKTRAQKTRITGWHRAHGAAMGRFSGYEMPLKTWRMLKVHVESIDIFQ